MDSLSTCHLGLWLGWQLLLNLVKDVHAGRDGKSIGVGIIVSEKISKDVAREERWQGRIIAAWMMVKKQIVCIKYVYGPQTGRAETENRPCGKSWRGWWDWWKRM